MSLALRVDVDFVVGLEEAVPRMLDELARHEMQATFFIVAGSNQPRRSLKRLLRPGYLQRLHALGFSGLIRSFGMGRGGERFLAATPRAGSSSASWRPDTRCGALRATPIGSTGSTGAPRST